MTKAQQQERDDAIQKLRDWLHPGDTVYTVLDSVSRSGTSRTIRVVLLSCEKHKIVDRHPNYSVGKALGLRHAKNRSGNDADGLIVSGGGMDMGFHLVYSLSRVLFPDGYGVQGEWKGQLFRPKDRAAAEHAVKHGAKFYGRNGDPSGWDHDGGYALNHRWL